MRDRGDRILFRSGDGNQYYIIIDGASNYFEPEFDYFFDVNPFNLSITDPATTETGGAELIPQIYVRVGAGVIKHDAPPKIIIGH